MADQTHGAVDSLLGLLSAAIKDEARLLGGVQGDIQFIKDEMDSMNGFLLHLTKMETGHNDQLRAWMKQVRDIAYIAQDCIELYMRDLTPLERGLWAHVKHVPVLLWKMPARHRLATKIRELKVRVRDVGERRLRYGATVPENAALKPEPVGQDNKSDDKSKREAFLRALEDDQKKAAPPSFSTAIHMLPLGLACEADTEIQAILNKCVPNHVNSMKMLLRALYAYPYGTKHELQTLLKKKLEDRAADVPKEVMIFCYSKLSTHYKSCLQYLTAFTKETSISRTSLVRRWVAEGLVARDEKLTLEQAGERCFDELVFRGFVCRFDIGPTGKVKSCKMDGSVRAFIEDITKSENFVAGLPTHLNYQLQIREKVLRRPQGPQQPQQKPWPWNMCDLCVVPRTARDESAGDSSTTADSKEPMDEIVALLKALPVEYRLNVLDLGGCRGLKKRQLKSICKVSSLKYLSLRNTDVSRLPRQIQALRLLETLDIRQTNVRATDTERIILPRLLKHLLAGRRIDCSSDGTRTMSKESSLSTVRMPRKIGKSMEILSHVEISRHGKAELEAVGNLLKLRKLGVVLHGSEENIKHFHRAISKLSGCLRSLSVWITPPSHTDGGVNLDHKEDDTTFSSPQHLESLNINGNIRNYGLPTWIHNHKHLSKVTLCETSLQTDQSLRILGKLEELRCLRLRPKSYIDPVLTFNNQEFQKLEFLLIEESPIGSSITFEAGTAPMLEKIVWTFDKTDTITGIQNLTSLKVLELKGETTLLALEQEIAALPNSNRPDLRYSSPDTIFEGST